MKIVEGVASAHWMFHATSLKWKRNGHSPTPLTCKFMQFGIAIAMNSTRIFKNNLSGSKKIKIKNKNKTKKKVKTLDFAIEISATRKLV